MSPPLDFLSFQRPPPADGRLSPALMELLAFVETDDDDDDELLVELPLVLGFTGHGALLLCTVEHFEQGGQLGFTYRVVGCFVSVLKL